MRLEVFDPAMCCSTGVCGPNPNAALAPFASDLDWLAAQGVEVRRYNLGQEPGAFVEHQAVGALLREQGEAVLPVVMVDGAVRSTARYPARAELAAWAGLAATPAVSAALIAELAAIGAAIGANCEPCFKYHYDQARKLGLTKGEITVAVRAAKAVKEVPSNSIIALAGKLLGADLSTPTAGIPIVALADITAGQPAKAASGCGCADTAEASPTAEIAAAACCGGPAAVAQSADPAQSKSCC